MAAIIKLRDNLFKWGKAGIRKATLQYLHAWYIYRNEKTWEKVPNDLIEHVSYRYEKWLEDIANSEEFR